MNDRASLFEGLRRVLARGRHDAQLLDARDFDPAPWDKAERDLGAVRAVVLAAAEVCEWLDEARDWHEERNQRDIVRQIDFAIGVTLSLRSALAQREIRTARDV